MAEQSKLETNQDAIVEAAARANALDRFLSARLAPRGARRDLIALAAFMGETARIVATAREPLVGEMRLQWWRDVLSSARSGEAAGNPIADALREMMARRALPVEPFLTLLDARSRALDPGFVADGAVLDRYLDETEGQAFRLAARILGVPAGEATDELLFAAGQAYGRAQLLRALPLMLQSRGSSSEGRLVNDWAVLAPTISKDARSWLQKARRLAHLAPSVVAAMLPIALVEPYLTALQRVGPDLVRRRAEITPLTRVWRLWWASARGKI
jgi:15-cis-phytoene synthase